MQAINLLSKEYERIERARTFRRTAHLSVLGLAVTFLIIRLGLGPSWIDLQWAMGILIVAGVGVEIVWKCVSAYCHGAARVRWMKIRDLLATNYGAVATHLNDMTTHAIKAQDSRITSIAKTTSSISSRIATFLADLNKVDELIMGAASPDKPPRLPMIWERLSMVLPRETRLTLFHPAYNDMLEIYMRTRQFLTGDERRWLGLAFTAWSLRLVMNSGRAALAECFLDVVPEPIRSWLRRW